MKVCIIGGGIFGLYIARDLLKEGFDVTIIEQDDKLFNGASKVNQARLHQGFHYPRSPETVKLCQQGCQDFIEEFPNTVNSGFHQIYAVSRFNSKTKFDDFKSFYKQESLKFEETILDDSFLSTQNLEGAVLTWESSFDYSLLGNQLESELIQLGCNILLGHKLIEGDLNKKSIILINNQTKNTFNYDYLINCTYSNINGINDILKVPRLPLKFELCEVLKVKVPVEFENYGFTIMDGDFMSIMPYGYSGYHTIWHVKHSVHEESFTGLPEFGCNKARGFNCKSYNLEICNTCQNKPNNTYSTIISDSKKFIPWIDKVEFVESLFVVKAVLNSAEESDARPSLVIDYPNYPDYFVIFSGKIDTLKYTSDKLKNKIKNLVNNE